MRRRQPPTPLIPLSTLLSPEKPQFSAPMVGIICYCKQAHTDARTHTADIEFRSFLCTLQIVIHVLHIVQLRLDFFSSSTTSDSRLSQSDSDRGSLSSGSNSSARLPSMGTEELEMLPEINREIEEDMSVDIQVS